MKHKITLTAIVFLATLFAFGQRTALNSNEIFWKSRTERQFDELKQDDYKVRQGHQFQKNRNFSQTPIFKFFQAIKQKLDSLVTLKWDETTSQWVAYTKNEYTYDINTNNTQSLYYNWQEATNQWVNSYKDENAYDANGNMIQYIPYQWYENQWVAYSKYEYTYDANGIKTQFLEYHWDDITSLWVASYKDEYTYDSNGNMIQELGYLWNENINQWVVSYKTEYTYDPNGNMTQELECDWDETTNQWVTVYKKEYTYDANGNMTQYIAYSWDETNNQWVANYKEEYTYDANGNMTQYIAYSWDENVCSWNAYYKIEYFYDTLGNIIQSFNYLWDDTASQWEATYKNETSYDISYSYSDLILPYSFSGENTGLCFNYMLTGIESYKWDTLSGDWKPQMEISFNYSEQEVTSVSEISKIELSVYPNPFSKSISFDISDYYDKIILEIFDIQGRKIISKEIRNHENLSMEGLNRGMYFYSLTINGKKLNGKLIRE